MAEELKLSRGWNHLGEIAKTLGDLRGLRTVIHELIQNADDAPAVTRMRFTVTDEVLEVWNDGEFERCSDLTTPECELLGRRGYRCDFHSFRDMGSGDKRNRAGTTGAFGMGFTAVYQLTDRPELLSNGERWVIDETANEDARITRTSAPAGHEGTAFRLPWATSPSRFRQATRQAVVSDEAIIGFYDELATTVPRAMPFLKNLKSIEIACGSRRCIYEREPSSNRLVVKSSGGVQWTWVILQGNFAERSEALKTQYPEQIEAARSAEVAVAFPLDADAAGGVLYASLPTEESSHLPLLINADFYPASDRKRIRFDDAPESEFNRTAIRAAARCIAADLAQLPDRLGDRAVVGVLVAALEISRRAGQEQIDSCFAEFWQEIVGVLPGAKIVPVASGGYECPTDVRLWREDAEVEAATVLAEIGIRLVDAGFRDDWYRLRSQEVGLQEVNVGDVVVRLRGAGLVSRSDASQLPGGLATERGIASLWGALEVLLAQSGRSTQESRKALQDCAVAPGADGALWPLSQLLATDAETEEILGDAGAATHFLDTERFGDYPSLADLVDVVDAGRFLELLESAEEAGTLRATLNSKLLLRWFYRRQADLSSEQFDRLACLPIFPTASGLRPLTDLVLPGDFNDPLGLTRLVAVDEIVELRPFLRTLGAQPLTFARYCIDFVRPVLADGDLLDDRRTELLRLLAHRLSEVRDDSAVREALVDLPLVPCIDGEWRVPNKVYLTTEVRTVLGSDAIVAVLPREKESAHRELFSWLGVAHEPRPEDVVTRCRAMVAAPSWHREAARSIVHHLGIRYNRDASATQVAFGALRECGWLPAQGDRSKGYRPEAVHTVFQRSLFASQAQFLDVDRPVQQEASKFLEWLGVRTVPEPQQVVAHLLWSSEHYEPVTEDVWIYLDQNATDPALDALLSRKCLLLDNGEYVRPSDVYWGEHPFGRWRFRLGPKFRIRQALLDRLDVAEGPIPADAVEVLRDIAAQHGGEQAPLLPADVPVVHHCWRLLTEGLASDAIDPSELDELRSDEVVLDASHWMRTPSDVFFRDSLSLADRFDESLRPRLIERPEGLWPALTAAGVRNLSDAVTTHVVELERIPGDSAIAERLRSRRGLLLRVLVDDPHAALKLDEFYEGVEIQQLGRLEIQQSLDVGEHHFSSALYARGALYQPAEHVLLCVERGGSPLGWVEVAREFVRALRLDSGSPSTVASAVKVVLEAESEESAAAELDELGFPALHRHRVEVVEGGIADEFGASPYDDAKEAASQGEEGTQEQNDAERADSDDDGDSRPATPSSDDDTTATSADSEGGTSDSTEGPETGEMGSRGTGDRPSGGESAGSGSRATTRALGGSKETSRSRLRSYVAPASGKSAATGTSQSDDDAVERAAVDAVLAYEEEHGRSPYEMPAMNPGFDVRSVDADGLVRIVEIKGTADRWDARGVALSSTQFTTAQQRREEFWLYVVEQALTNPVVHAINDPASKVDQYFFDDGWRAVTEAEPSSRPRLVPLVLVHDSGPSPTMVRYFEMDNPTVGVASAEDGWVGCPDPRPEEDWFAVRITGFGLGLAFYGGIAVVAPTGRNPEDGELALVLLHEQTDPDSDGPMALRRWTPERDLDGNQLALRLASDGSVEPLTVTAPDEVRVLGLVRATIRPDDVVGVISEPDT